MKKAIILFLSLTTIYSCKKVESNDLKDTVPFNQSYTVLFDKTNGTTSASASFKANDAAGTRIELSDAASVTANGSKMTSPPFDKALYNWYSASLTDVEFVLTKNSGDRFINKVLLANVEEIDFPQGFPGNYNKADGISFVWSGNALSSDETVLASIAGTDMMDNSLNTSISKTVTGHDVHFSSSDLDKFKPGTIHFSLERVKRKGVENPDGNAGGGLSVTFVISRDGTLN